jgi:hypothetical protein
MKKILSCREVWCYDDCDYIITEETEEDVVISTAKHGIKKHGKSKRDMVKLGEKLGAFIYTIS